jgi:hypothetical protein
METFSVAIAVNLYDKASLAAMEVDNVRFERSLPDKLQTRQFSAPQAPPKTSFRIS